VVEKRSIFGDATPCSPLKVNRRFGGTCHLHFRVEERAKQEANIIGQQTDLCLMHLCSLSQGNKGLNRTTRQKITVFWVRHREVRKKSIKVSEGFTLFILRIEGGFVEALSSKMLATLYPNLRSHIAESINVIAMRAGPANIFNRIRIMPSDLQRHGFHTDRSHYR
jgi:hypothetical protein